MWPQIEMVAWEINRERDRRFARSERLRIIRDEAEHGFAPNPLLPVGLMVAFALLAVVSRIVLI